MIRDLADIVIVCVYLQVPANTYKKATIPKPPLRGEQRTIALAMRESPSLVVEVARQRRDGGVSGICMATILFFYGSKSS